MVCFGDHPLFVNHLIIPAKKPKASHCLPVHCYTKLLEREMFNGNKHYEFPVGQRVCARCSIKIKTICNSISPESLSIDQCEVKPRPSKVQAQRQIQELSVSCFESESGSESSDSSNSMMIQAMSLHEINELLSAVSKNIKPFTYQVRQSVDSLSSVTIRQPKRDYQNTIKQFSSFICESMAPSQGEHWHQLFRGEEETANEIDPKLESIVEAYHSTSNPKWKVFLLSVVPDRYTSKELQVISNCKKYLIDKSHFIRSKSLQFDLMEKKVIRRERVDNIRIEFFFDFLFTSGLIQDVAYGTTMMQFENNDKILIPHVVRTMIKTHIFQLYEQHCMKTSCPQPISRSTVFRLLNVCKMRKKKTMCGLDSFAVDGNAGFDTLQCLVKEFRLDSIEEKNLLQLIKLGRNYLKIEYKQKGRI